MQLEYFLNLCGSVIHHDLQWLSNPVAQEQDWNSLPPGLLVAEEAITRYFDDYELIKEAELFETKSSHPAFTLLKELRDKLEDYYYGKETVLTISRKEKLLKHPKWIEIQHLARRAHKELDRFIEQERHNL